MHNNTQRIESSLMSTVKRPSEAPGRCSAVQSWKAGVAGRGPATGSKMRRAECAAQLCTAWAPCCLPASPPGSGSLFAEEHHIHVQPTKPHPLSTRELLGHPRSAVC